MKFLNIGRLVDEASFSTLTPGPVSVPARPGDLDRKQGSPGSDYTEAGRSPAFSISVSSYHLSPSLHQLPTLVG